MTKQEIAELIINGEITLSDVIDVVIDINGVIGVGLITFSDDVANYICKNGSKENSSQLK